MAKDRLFKQIFLSKLHHSTTVVFAAQLKLTRDTDGVLLHIGKLHLRMTQYPLLSCSYLTSINIQVVIEPSPALLINKLELNRKAYRASCMCVIEKCPVATELILILFMETE